MAHLGSDVAAYVDGQLSAPAMQDARRHLEDCAACRLVVMQQETLKKRIRHVNAPQPTEALVASLANLQDRPIEHESRWSRLRESTPVRFVMVLASASAVLVAAAYVVGAPSERVGDPVTPDVSEFARAFAGIEQPATHTVAHTMSGTSIAELEAAGWPSRAHLGAHFSRVSAALVDDDKVVDLTYSDGASRIRLFEQSGTLDPSNLDGFELRTVAGSRVWVREAMPLIATWDGDGVVFTVVTDADAAELEGVVADLPARSPRAGGADRIHAGLTRIAKWVNPL